METIYDKVAINSYISDPMSETIGEMWLDEYKNGLIGCFTDSDDQPEWVRNIARYEHDRFKSEAKYYDFDQYCAPIQGISSGVDRCCNWNFAIRIAGPSIYKYTQDYGSCVFASKTKAVPQLLGTLILGMQQPATLQYPISVAGYAQRNHCGQGTSLSVAASFFSKCISYRKVYLDGKYDLREEDKDESLAQNNWCRSGVPNDLFEEFKKDGCFQTLSYMSEMSKDRFKDICVAGGVIDTGSNYTAAGAGDPISPSVQRIGGHDQVFAGFDDSEEFREWYRTTTGKTINEMVVMMHQTWGPNWLRVTNWPTHLWGDRPEGMVVLPYSKARSILDENYAWLPQATGYKREKIVWA